ncbi:MAG: hypothetical protein HY080_07005 [Gammaproteobacteria bacterium]|nr:hypothetical protein [Gammaproteobacteria bacterium]
MPTDTLKPSYSADLYNQSCHCSTLDSRLIDQELALLESRPHLFSSTPVFITHDQLAEMQRVIAAVETVVALPAYQQQVLTWAPSIAGHAPNNLGVFLGYDFHINADGAKLIEINSNAGGAMLNVALMQAQQRCCDNIEPATNLPQLELTFYNMFTHEWRLQRDTAPLRTVAIIDIDPTQQYLYPEFTLFARLFETYGLQAVITDPQQLEYKQAALWYGDQRIDLVYNRLTDFDFSSPACAALRAAYLADAVVVTPHPRVHALYADKRNLTLLANPDNLAALHVPSATINTLAQGIPSSRIVTPSNAEHFWASRKQWFFKPFGGFGGKAVYRGDKLTRKVFAAIAQGGYIAQALVAPGERRAKGGVAPVLLKVDWRNYVYNRQTQLVSARLYQGQTTNFRTQGGGFAPVYFTATSTVACPTGNQSRPSSL